MLKRAVIIIIIMGLLSACASFYEVSHDFNQQFEQGNIDLALEQLQNDRQYAKTNIKFLYYLNTGLLLSMKGQYKESNIFFEKAFIFGEDYKVNYAAEGASYFTNPLVTVYRGEDHEHLMPLYYKAINFMKMLKYDEALVECKRLNIRLQQLADKYKSPKKFQRDAFIHTLMGIIYQTTKDWNNAFIAYRNAYEIYESDYVPLFGLHAPNQLKHDLLVSAWNVGFNEEFDFYKRKFDWPDFKVSKSEAELVFFWHNGLGPIKDEWSLNFSVKNANENVFIFSNQSIATNFSFLVNDKSDRSDLRDLGVLRVAFPKYVERPVYFGSASIAIGDTTYPLQLAEDINKIATKSLQDRMTLEFSKSLLRAALKKTAEKSVRKKDKGLGTLLSVVNAVTERADTRNWQTLPHGIFYCRVPLAQGVNNILLTLHSWNGEDTEHRFIYDPEINQTLFHTFASLESRRVGN